MIFHERISNHLRRTCIVNEMSIASKLMNCVCSVFGLERNIVISKSREQNTLFARHAFVYMCIQAGLTHSAIASYLGTNHTTITTNIKPINQLFSTNYKGFTDKVNECKNIYITN